MLNYHKGIEEIIDIYMKHNLYANNVLNLLVEESKKKKMIFFFSIMYPNISYFIPPQILEMKDFNGFLDILHAMILEQGNSIIKPDHQSASEIYHQYSQKSNTSVLEYLAFQFEQEHKYDEAIKLYQQMDNDKGNFHLNRIEIKQNEGDSIKVQEIIEKISKNLNQDNNALLIGDTYYHFKEYDKCLLYLKPIAKRIYRASYLIQTIIFNKLVQIRNEQKLLKSTKYNHIPNPCCMIKSFNDKITKNTHMFDCLTCGIIGCYKLCFHCVLKYHFDHFVIDAGKYQKTRFPCCHQLTKQKEEEKEEEEEEEEAEEKIVSKKNLPSRRKKSKIMKRQRKNKKKVFTMKKRERGDKNFYEPFE